MLFCRSGLCSAQTRLDCCSFRMSLCQKLRRSAVALSVLWLAAWQSCPLPAGAVFTYSLGAGTNWRVWIATKHVFWNCSHSMEWSKRLFISNFFKQTLDHIISTTASCSFKKSLLQTQIYKSCCKRNIDNEDDFENNDIIMLLPQKVRPTRSSAYDVSSVTKSRKRAMLQILLQFARWLIVSSVLYRIVSPCVCAWGGVKVVELEVTHKDCCLVRWSRHLQKLKSIVNKRNEPCARSCCLRVVVTQHSGFLVMLCRETVVWKRVNGICSKNGTLFHGRQSWICLHRLLTLERSPFLRRYKSIIFTLVYCKQPDVIRWHEAAAHKRITSRLWEHSDILRASAPHLGMPEVWISLRAARFSLGSSFKLSRWSRRSWAQWNNKKWRMRQGEPKCSLWWGGAGEMNPESMGSLCRSAMTTNKYYLLASASFGQRRLFLAPVWGNKGHGMYFWRSDFESCAGWHGTWLLALLCGNLYQ